MPRFTLKAFAFTFPTWTVPVVQPCALTHSAVLRCLLREGRNLYPLHRGQGDTWALFGLTSLSEYLALGEETLCLVVGESGKSFGETVGGLRGSELWITPCCRFIPLRGPGQLGGNQGLLSCFEHMEVPSVLAFRDILTYNLGLGHQGTHDPILPSLLNLMLGQGFALSLGPASCYCILLQSCFSAQGGAAPGKRSRLEKSARKGDLWNGGTPWVVSWAQSSWAVYSGLYHPSSFWQGLLSHADKHRSGQCSGARESQGAGINWVTCASCFEHKKRCKMLIITMRCLRALFNLLVAVFYTVDL